MEKLETKTERFTGKTELRCKGWCHSKYEITYNADLPDTEYFN
jgi:hypothetical protein